MVVFAACAAFEGHYSALDSTSHGQSMVLLVKIRVCAVAERVFRSMIAHAAGKPCILLA